MVRYAIALIIGSVLLIAACEDDPVSSESYELVVTPQQFTYTAPHGGPSPIDAFVSIREAGGAQIPYRFQKSANWYSAAGFPDPQFRATPDTLRIDYTVTFLEVGTYYDTIFISSDSAGNNPQRVEIIMNIGTELRATPPVLSFETENFDLPPTPQDVICIGTGDQVVPYAVDEQPSWIVLTGFKGTTPDTVTVSVDPTGLGTGIFVDNLVFSATGVLNPPVTVLCSLNLPAWLELHAAVSEIAQVARDMEAVKFIDDQTGFAVGGAGSVADRTGFIFETTDGGQNWSLNFLLPPSSSVYTRLNDLEFVGMIGWAVGESGVILKTENAGQDWVYQSTGLADTVRELKAVDFIDANRGWAVGEDGLILRTISGGTIWVQQTSNVTANLQSVHFVDDQNGFAVGVASSIARTTNGGSTWTRLTSLTDLVDLSDLHFVDATTGWIVGTNGRVYRTENGGDSWTRQSTPVTDGLTAVTFVNDSTGWVSGRGGVVLYTQNRGQNWIKQNTKTSVSLSDIMFINDSLGWVIGEDGFVLKTTSGGN